MNVGKRWLDQRRRKSSRQQIIGLRRSELIQPVKTSGSCCELSSGRCSVPSPNDLDKRRRVLGCAAIQASSISAATSGGPKWSSSYAKRLIEDERMVERTATDSALPADSAIYLVTGLVRVNLPSIRRSSKSRLRIDVVVLRRRDGGVPKKILHDDRRHIAGDQR